MPDVEFTKIRIEDHLNADEMYAELEKSVLAMNPAADAGRIRAAYDCACIAHSGQKRREGSDYVTHCVAAAEKRSMLRIP